MGKRKTTEEFIADARKVHGDKYDYSLVEYTGTQNKIIVICRDHGAWEPYSLNHLRGCGCPKCATEERTLKQTSSTEEFIKKAKVVYGDRYNYSLVNYTRNNIKVKITCKLHGVFECAPSNFLRGRGCPQCADIARKRKLKLGRNTFIERAISIHGDRYDYSLVKYVNNRVKVEITCRKEGHGRFKQAPDMHLAGQGCPKCGVEARSGEKHHNYKDGKSDQRDLERKTSEYYHWRKQVSGGKLYCDCCGAKFKTGDQKHAHHLYSWIDNRDKRFDVNNGVCICESCHDDFHSEYGAGNNTPLQYELFKEMRNNYIVDT